MTKAKKQREIVKCLQKITYYNPVDADLVIADLWAHKRWDRSKYKCPWCSFWHLSGSPWRLEEA